MHFVRVDKVIPYNVEQLFDIYQPQRPLTADHFITAVKTRRTTKPFEQERFLNPWKTIGETDELVFQKIDGVS